MTIKIICDGAGMAREVNPNQQNYWVEKDTMEGHVSAEWQDFSRTHPPLPVYHNSTLFMEKGERSAELVWEHFDGKNWNRQTEYEMSLSPIGKNYSSFFRQVYEIYTPSSVTAMGGEEREFKGTKGPWSAINPVDVWNGEDNMKDNGGNIVCTCYGPDKAENIKLIAAAPELLEALQGIISIKNKLSYPAGMNLNHPKYYDELRVVDSIFNKAKEAINKSLGL